MKQLTNGSTIFDPLNNFLFYKIFGEEGDEVQLLGFINAVLGKTGNQQFTSVKIYENKSFMADVAGKKSCTLDVRAQLPSGAYVNVEVQLKNKHDFDRRSLFYMSKIYTKDLDAGKDYIILPNVIAINIMGFNYPRTNNFHSCFHLREDIEREIILTDALEIHFINMVKYKKQKKTLTLDDPLCRWLAWFDKKSPKELREEVVKMDAAIMSAEEKFKVIRSLTDDEWHYYTRCLLAEYDRASEINYRTRKAEEKTRRAEEKTRKAEEKAAKAEKKFQSIVSDKDAEIERLRALLENK